MSGYLIRSLLKKVFGEFYKSKLELSEDLTIAPPIVLSEEKDKFVTENWRESKMDQ